MDGRGRARRVPPVDIVPLGGLGEFGLNMMAISCGETTIVIDAGSMFPEPDLLGVDLIIPDLTYLEARRGQIKALILTHGHEDHIGAVPYVLPLVDGPLYGTPLALALVEPKLEEHGIDHAPGHEGRQAARRRHASARFSSSSSASRTACPTVWPSSFARRRAC